MDEPTTEVLSRTLAPADLEIRSDGRTIYGMVAPFNREAVVMDLTPFGVSKPYREVFRPGAFAESLRTARIKLFVNHNKQRLPIGKPVNLTEDAHGLTGEFRISQTREGNEALELVRDGVLDAFSVGFRPVPGGDRRSGDLVERTRVALREVSVTAFPAYESALITGIRSDDLEAAGWTLDDLVELARTHDLRALLEQNAATTDEPPSDEGSQSESERDDSQGLTSHTPDPRAHERAYLFETRTPL